MAVPKVHKKIYLILEFLQKKLQTNYDIDIRGFTEEEKEKYPNANFLVGPTQRGREDIEAFSIHVHRRVAADKKPDADYQLFSSVLHEMIHTIYWSVADCHATALREVRSKVMKQHLDQEMYDSREQGTYKLERAIAPILWNEFLIDTENKVSYLMAGRNTGQKESKSNASQEGRIQDGESNTGEGTQSDLPPVVQEVQGRS